MKRSKAMAKLDAKLAAAFLALDGAETAAEAALYRGDGLLIRIRQLKSKLDGIIDEVAARGDAGRPQ